MTTGAKLQDKKYSAVLTWITLLRSVQFLLLFFKRTTLEYIVRKLLHILFKKRQ